MLDCVIINVKIGDHDDVIISQTYPRERETEREKEIEREFSERQSCEVRSRARWDVRSTKKKRRPCVYTHFLSRNNGGEDFKLLT